MSSAPTLLILPREIRDEIYTLAATTSTLVCKNNSTGTSGLLSSSPLRQVSRQVRNEFLENLVRLHKLEGLTKHHVSLDIDVYDVNGAVGEWMALFDFPDNSIELSITLNIQVPLRIDHRLNVQDIFLRICERLFDTLIDLASLERCGLTVRFSLPDNIILSGYQDAFRQSLVLVRDSHLHISWPMVNLVGKRYGIPMKPTAGIPQSWSGWYALLDWICDEAFAYLCKEYAVVGTPRGMETLEKADKNRKYTAELLEIGIDGR